MRIVLDFRPALRQSTGVGTYAYNLISALAESFPEDSYTAFTASWRDRVNRSLLPDGVAVTDWKIPVRALDWTWNRWQWPSVERLVGTVANHHALPRCQSVRLHDAGTAPLANVGFGLDPRREGAVARRGNRVSTRFAVGMACQRASPWEWP